MALEQALARLERALEELADSRDQLADSLDLAIGASLRCVETLERAIVLVHPTDTAAE